MTIRWRLLSAFALVLFVAVAATLLLLTRFEGELERELGRATVTRARSLLDTLDRELAGRLETLTGFLQTSPEVAILLAESNRQFGALGSDAMIAAEISRRDADWSSGGATTLPLIAAIGNNPVAAQLRNKQAFFRELYGYDVFSEIFLTNRYGANVAQTAPTTDYRQDDEDWWQRAFADGYFVGDLEYDDSAGVLAVEIAVRVNDDVGAGMGVLKGVLNVEEVHDLVRRFRQDSEYESVVVHLFDASGQPLLSVGNEEQTTPLAVTADFFAGNEGFSTDGADDHLLAYATARGYRDFRGLRWRCVLAIDRSELLAPLSGLRRTMLTAGLGGLLVALLLAYTIATTISRPIEDAVSATMRLAGGDLDTELSANASGEVGQLLGAMRSMLANMREALGGMISTAHGISTVATSLIEVGNQLSGSAGEQSQATLLTSTSTEQMATSIRQVSKNAERVAGVLEEASAAMEQMAHAVHAVAGKSQELAAGVDQTMATVHEMVSSIEAVADNAARAQEASQTAVAEAAAGSAAVRATIEGMTSISTSMHDIVTAVRRLDERSRRITQITASIEQIAKQSHLLALNATVQAAHAGEHGRGFATVADEVGRLAERSAGATREIGATLSEIQVEVRRALTLTESGSRLAGDGMRTAASAGEVLDNIALATEELSSMMLQVRAATAEQANATSEMATTFERMRHLTTEVERATTEQAVSSERINRNIEAMHTMAVEVSTASSEQSRGSEEIAQSIVELAAIATRNADTANQIAASSRHLEEQASALRQASAFFALKRQQASSSEPVAG